VRTENPSGRRSEPTRGSVPPGGITGLTSSALSQLTRDLQGDSAIVDRFVVDYLSLLDDRVYRLSRLLQGTDEDATLVAILSLETTSAMIGATDVVQVVPALREAAESHQDDLTTSALAQLDVAVTAVRGSLANLGFSAVPRPRQAGA
jgi:hypothetical protein